jgi:hypothetical protein
VKTALISLLITLAFALFGILQSIETRMDGAVADTTLYL